MASLGLDAGALDDELEDAEELLVLGGHLLLHLPAEVLEECLVKLAPHPLQAQVERLHARTWVCNAAE